jgi:GNAT superfamily N-acetyltransferase
VSADGGAVHDQLDRHLRARLRADGGVVELATFLARFDEETASPFRNYAMPEPGAAPSAADVAVLVDGFRQRGRVPRVEYFPASAPAVERALIDGGFVVDLRPPVMTCRPGGHPPVDAVAGVHISAVDPASAVDVAGVCLVAHLAFEEAGMPEESDLRRLTRMLERGGAAVLARTEDDDDPVGGAQYPGAVEGIVEFVGVSVAEDQRRRGIAGALVSRLLDEAARREVALAWLTPGGEGAERVYARAGFATATEALHMSLVD